MCIRDRVPLVEKLLLRARQKAEIQFDDIQAAAMFCVYGQLGILLADDLDVYKRQRQQREYMRKKRGWGVDN